MSRLDPSISLAAKPVQIESPADAIGRVLTMRDMLQKESLTRQQIATGQENARRVGLENQKLDRENRGNAALAEAIQKNSRWDLQMDPQTGQVTGSGKLIRDHDAIVAKMERDGYHEWALKYLQEQHARENDDYEAATHQAALLSQRTKKLADTMGAWLNDPDELRPQTYAPNIALAKANGADDEMLQKSGVSPQYVPGQSEATIRRLYISAQQNPAEAAKQLLDAAFAQAKEKRDIETHAADIAQKTAQTAKEKADTEKAQEEIKRLRSGLPLTPQQPSDKQKDYDDFIKERETNPKAAIYPPTRQGFARYYADTVKVPSAVEAADAVVRARMDAQSPNAADPQQVKYWADQVQRDASKWNMVQGQGKGMADAVTTELSRQGKDVNKLSESSRQMSEMAKEILPHIDTVGSEADQLNKLGLMGPIGGRWREFITGGNVLGAQFDKLTSEQKTLVGKFRTDAGLLKTAVARAHGGARGGGSPFMLEHMNTMLNANSVDLDVFKGGLSGFKDWMQGYSQMIPPPASAKEIPTPKGNNANPYR